MFYLEDAKWFRLRVAVFTPGAKPNDLKFDGGSCTVYKVASDGVWHNAPFTTYGGPSFELTGASRADFAVSRDIRRESCREDWDRSF